jgi:hypothetical protein
MVCRLILPFSGPKFFAGDMPRGFINNTSWRPALARPLLGLTAADRDRRDWGNDQFVVSVGEGNRKTVVDLIVNNIEMGDHPFHLVRTPFLPFKHRLNLFAVAAWSSFLSSANARGRNGLWILPWKLCPSFTHHCSRTQRHICHPDERVRNLQSHIR